MRIKIPLFRGPWEGNEYYSGERWALHFWAGREEKDPLPFLNVYVAREVRSREHSESGHRYWRETTGDGVMVGRRWRAQDEKWWGADHFWYDGPHCCWWLGPVMLFRESRDCGLCSGER
jgi:hypothetical protein